MRRGIQSIMNHDVNLSDLIAELRQNDGKMLRRLLKLLRETSRVAVGIV
jgi:hypothetical protein